MTGIERSSGDQTVTVYPVSAAWSEKTITATPGIGAALTNVSSAIFSASTWANFSLPSGTVQAWLTNSASNYGVLIRTANDDPPGWNYTYPYRLKATFASKEDLTITLRPKLTITYTPPASPNVRPLVGIVTPQDNAVYGCGEAAPIIVNASDPDGTVTNVRLYAGSALVAQYTNAPCTNIWYSWIPGSTSLTAVAYDNGGGCSTSAPVTLRTQNTVYLANMDSNPGWSYNGSVYWGYGKPTGSGPPTYGGGYADPSLGYNGTNVIGYNLNGCVDNYTTPEYARTPAIDCRGYTNVCVEYFGWLGALWCTATVEVSTNGTNWTTVWSNPSNLSGAGWWFSKLDISAYANGKPTVYVRWGFVTSSGNTGYYSCGWNIDDVRITGAGNGVVASDIQAVTFNEGSNATFSARLPQIPDGLTTVTVARVSGDAAITVSGGATLVFGTNNWNNWQTVTVSAPTDAGAVNSTAMLQCSCPGFLASTVSVTAVDLDCGVPTGVDAANGVSQVAIPVVWNTAANAMTYEVWRNTTSATGTALRVASGLTAPGWVDTAALPGTNYYYWVRSLNTVCTSDFSTVDVGFLWPAYLKWGYKTKLQFTGYTRGEALTNFPVLVTVGTNLPGFAYSQMVSPSDAGDLRFADAGEISQLNYEPDVWTTGGVSKVWVQVPVLTNGGSIWMYWGSPLRKTPPACTTNGAVWDDKFRGVWHLNEAAGALVDSTRNRNTGTRIGTVAGAGQIGGAQIFSSASSNQIDCGNRVSLQSLTNLTLSVWLNPTVLTGERGLASKWNSSWCWVLNHDGTDVAGRQGLYFNGWQTATTAVATGQWSHVAVSYGAGAMAFYLNGQPDGTAAQAAGPGAAGNLRFGTRQDSGGGYFDGSMDEIRVESVKRSSNWVWACCQTMLSNQSFISVAAPATNQMTLTVSSVTTSAPMAGVYSYAYGQAVTGTVSSPVFANGTKYTILTWQVVPSEGTPSSGSGSSVPLVMNNDQTLTWGWRQFYLLTATAGPNGSVVAPASGTYCTSNAAATATATPTNYYHFAGWAGDVPPDRTVSNPVSLVMTQPRTVQAVFAEDQVTNSTPVWWLAQYGWTNSPDTWALQDSDGDGMTNWQEAAAGTDPQSWSSKLMVTNAVLSVVGGGRVVSWSSVSGRLYTIERSTNLMAEVFEPVASNLPAYPPVNTYTDAVPPEATFYRIKAERAP